VAVAVSGVVIAELIPERLRVWLRGDYNSVRYRFVSLPKEWLIYSAYRLAGWNWIDFYAVRMDKAGMKSCGKGPKPSLEYVADAERHFEFLKDCGLRPNDRFLDYGCGVMRLGLYLIPYLQPKRYTGVDISRNRMEIGYCLIESSGISRDALTTFVVPDLGLSELKGRQFDIVWAKSVFTHMPLADISVALRSIAKLLAPDGRFFFTYAVRERPKRRNLKDFFYTTEMMRNVSEAAGFSFAVCSEWDPGERGDVMACVSLPKKSIGE
jgi:SAM-dependent methyltransferase